jgi:hypothetical protein
MWGISWLAEKLLASQEGFCSLELGSGTRVGWLVNNELEGMWKEEVVTWWNVLSRVLCLGRAKARRHLVTLDGLRVEIRTPIHTTGAIIFQPTAGQILLRVSTSHHSQCTPRWLTYALKYRQKMFYPTTCGPWTDQDRTRSGNRLSELSWYWCTLTW